MASSKPRKRRVKPRNPFAVHAWRRKAGPMTSPNQRRQKGKKDWDEDE